MELPERKKRILQAIIESYINDAEPVGSKHLASNMGISVSPATIRNEMAELLEMGFLDQPHTSAGRVPSQMGYRFYVNSLMNRYRLSVEETEKINRIMQNRIVQLEKLVSEAGRAVSQLTNYTTVAMPVKKNTITIKKIELVFVDSYNFVLVLLTTDGMMKSKSYRTAFYVPLEVIIMLSRILNERLCNLPLDRINLPLISNIERDFGQFSALVTPILRFISESLENEFEEEIFTSGINNIFDLGYKDINNVKSMISFLNDKEEVKKLLSKDNDENIRVYIGKENEQVQMENSSIIIGNCVVGGKKVGTIGIIGPTRMDYRRVVSQLEFFTERLKQLFDGSLHLLEAENE